MIYFILAMCILPINLIIGLIIFAILLAVVPDNEAWELINWLTEDITGNRFTDFIVRLIAISLWPWFIYESIRKRHINKKD